MRERLAAEMTQAAERLEFERAARLRDRISALSAIQGAQGINPRSVEEADVFAIAKDAGRFCIEAFFFRAFQNWGNRAYFPRADQSLSEEEVLAAFLAQFYGEHPSAPLVLLSHQIEDREILEDALYVRAKRRVEVLTPQRGEKRELVEHALTNARQTLGRKLAEDASQEKLLAALGGLFGLPTAAASGRSLRQFAHRRHAGHRRDDRRGAGRLHEGALPHLQHRRRGDCARRRLCDDARRFLRAASRGWPRKPRTRADAEAFPSKPDLVLIDGGRGQFDVAREMLAARALTDVAIVGIAKGADRNAGRETFFVEGREPFRLPPHDPALYFVQRLRDEAHRFAIGTHRAKRKKPSPPTRSTRSPASARRASARFVLAFGSAKAIAGAALADLEKTPGVNKATARLVFEHFQRGD